MGEQARDLAVERFGLGEIHQPNGAPADLVFVGRADAALGGADLHAAEVRRFAKRVELAMQRENERNVFGDLEVIWRHFHALGANFVDLVDQMVGVEHDAVADHRQLAGPHDARGQQRELVDLGRRRPACGRRCGRPGNAPPRRRPPTASRRSCPCPRRPIGRRPPPRSPSPNDSSSAETQNPGASDNGLDRGSLRAWTTRLNR